MQKVKNGDYVTVAYDGLLENGEIFESSSETGPLEFTIGQNCVFPSFEAAIIGMKPGESKIVKVGPEEAYGQHNKDLVQTLSHSALAEGIDPQPGLVIGMAMEVDGQTHKVPATIIEIDSGKITIDYNHPLAGQELQYKITLRNIAATPAPGTISSGCN